VNKYTIQQFGEALTYVYTKNRLRLHLLGGSTSQERQVAILKLVAAHLEDPDYKLYLELKGKFGE